MANSVVATRDSAGKSGQPRAWVDAVEIAIGYGLIEAALWTEGAAHLWWSLAALAWFLGATIAHRPPLRELGLGRQGLKESAPFAAFGVLVAGAIVLAGRAAGTLHPLYDSAPAWGRVLFYVAWALGQQFIAQSFIFTRLERVLGKGARAVILTALLFSLAHVPNLFLTLVTLAGGLVFSEVFRRHRNIYPLAAVHALIGLALAFAVPEHALRHLRVGIGYLHYRGWPFGY